MMAEPEYVRIHTESPLDEMWAYFRRFELIDWVAGGMQIMHSEPTAEAVGHCVRQAREYFKSARTAPLLTRPVLLYYGMVSLAKLILLLDQAQPLDMDQIEELERKGHGLRQYDPEPGQDDRYQLENAMIEVSADEVRGGRLRGRGIFPQLAARISTKSAAAWHGGKVHPEGVVERCPTVGHPIASGARR